MTALTLELVVQVDADGDSDIDYDNDGGMTEREPKPWELVNSQTSRF